jgi:SAM-dependent methyltransferase
LFLKAASSALNLNHEQNHFEVDPKVLRIVRTKKQSVSLAREVLLCLFVEELSKLNLKRVTKVAVIGGSGDEPEISVLRDLLPSFELSILGVDNLADTFFDLNTTNPSHSEKYDLILCSQVLEHIWEHSNAFIQFQKLLATGGHLWVSCPASNRPHGSPDYFSAGFTSSFLVNHAEQVNLTIRSSGTFGSKRNYFAVHLLNNWLTSNGHEWPILFCFEGKKYWKQIVLTARYFSIIIMLHFVSKKLTTSPRYSTESWLLAYKGPENSD